MLIQSKKIQDDLGVRSSWISSRFSHIAEDWSTSSNRSMYDVDKMLNVAINYNSNTRNPIQKIRSENMMRELISYLQRIKK